jgi:uncharacterized protein YbjQ (UPF0145 family)
VTDYIDKRAFSKAMQDAGVHPSGVVTAEEWLNVWEGYARRRMDRFKAFVAGVSDLVTALRDKLRGHKAAEATAKAQLVSLEAMRDEARAIGADELVLRISRQIGSLKHHADYAVYDARATRRAAYSLGIDLQETESD